MRLSSARVEQTLSQFEARVLPDNHPSMPKIREVWGDHTYFLAVNGLNIALVRSTAWTSVSRMLWANNYGSWTDSQVDEPFPEHVPEPTQASVQFALDDRRVSSKRGAALSGASRRVVRPMLVVSMTCSAFAALRGYAAEVIEGEIASGRTDWLADASL